MSQKFFSVPGMSPSGGEGKMNGRDAAGKQQMPSEEQLKARYPSYYKNRGEASTASFMEIGDRIRIHGDEAEVKHIEKNADGSQEMTLARSSATDSGTYVAKIEPDKNRKQQIKSLKRSFD